MKRVIPEARERPCFNAVGRVKSVESGGLNKIQGEQIAADAHPESVDAGVS